MVLSSVLLKCLFILEVIMQCFSVLKYPSLFDIWEIQKATYFNGVD